MIEPSKRPALSCGLNAAEDAIAWALAHHKSDRALLSSLPGEARAGMHAQLAEVPDDGPERVVMLDAWRELGRRADRLEERAHPGVLDATEALSRSASVSRRAQRGVLKLALGAHAVGAWPHAAYMASPLRLTCEAWRTGDVRRRMLRAMAAWHLACLALREGRRRLARMRAGLDVGLRAIFDEAVTTCPELHQDTCDFARWALLDLGRSATPRLDEVGLYLYCAAAAKRFEMRRERWLTRLSRSELEVARRFIDRLAGRVSRPVASDLRRSIGLFWFAWDRASMCDGASR